MILWPTWLIYFLNRSLPSHPQHRASYQKLDKLMVLYNILTIGLVRSLVLFVESAEVAFLV